MISQGLIDSIKRLSKESNGKEYIDTEAKEAGERLVSFFELLIQIDKRNKQKRIIKKG